MSLDFLKNPEVDTIVNTEYSDAQLNRARDYIKNYQGEDVYKDFLEEVPFDITADNREEYWHIRNTISPLSVKKTEAAFIKDIENTIGNMQDPLEVSMYLRDGAGTWSQSVVDYFSDTMDSYNQFITGDTLHKDTVSYKANLDARLTEFFASTTRYLDPMVGERDHADDLSLIESLDLWGYMDLNKEDGRFGITTRDGDWLPAHGLSEDIKSYSEFEGKIPQSEEQYHIRMNSAAKIKAHLAPVLQMSRQKLLREKQEVNNLMFNNLKSGSIDKTDAAPIIVNKLRQSSRPPHEIISEGFDGVINNSVGDISKNGASLLGEIISLYVKRGEL